MWHEPGKVIITEKNFDFIEVDGCKFLVNDQIDSVQRIKGNLWFRNMRETDIGVDIGANIGAITIPMAKKMKKVYAIEPLFGDILKRNIELNNLHNVEVLECGIGYPARTEKVEFSSRQGKMKIHTLDALRKYIGKPIDWLKMDGEGCEWEICLGALDSIRELRIEFHVRRPNKKNDLWRFGHWERWTKNRGYKCEITRGAVPGPCVPFSECILLNASKEA